MCPYSKIKALSRRNFIQAAGAVAAAPFFPKDLLAAPARMPQSHFAVHPFIEANPKAVFIKRTNVPHKMDEPSKLREGVNFAREVFVPDMQKWFEVRRRYIQWVDGHLAQMQIATDITVRKADGSQSCYYGPCEYTSGKILSRGLREVQYGKITA